MLSQLGSMTLLALALVLAWVPVITQAATPPAIPQAGSQHPQPGIARETPTEHLRPPGVISGDRLTNTQFKNLPDSAVIDIRGTRTTAGELRAKLRQQEAQALARAQAAAGQAQAAFQAHHTKFLQDQKAKLQADSAKASAEFTRWRQTQGAVQVLAQEAIAEQAIELMGRSKTATPAEQVQIEQRAGELLKQLQLQQVPR